MKIIGIGDNVVDRYINKNIMFPGGNAVNFAVYASQCGADAAYLGVIADDKEGRLVRDSLESLGVDVSMSPLVPGKATERCDVVLDDGDRVFQGSTYGEGEWTPLRLTDEHIEYLKGFDLIHCGCYASMEDEIIKLKDIDAIKTFDFSAEEEFKTDEYLNKVCPYIDIALFSAEEMSEEQTEALQKKVADMGVSVVLVTNGKKGQKVWDGSKMRDGVVKLIQPVDTMGAGDSFFTAFVVELARTGKKCSEYDDEDFAKALDTAAGFSAQTCLVEGAFGFGTHYEDE